MKKFIHFLSILLLQTSFYIKPNNIRKICLDDRPYQKQAANWVKTYILGGENNLLICPKEVQLIANLIYFSLRRSQYTLLAQEKALNSLNITWQAWQNIAQTRLDPSQKTPYEIPDCEKQIDLPHFWQIYDKYRKIGLTYSATVKNIVDGNFLVTTVANNCVTNMRDQARTVVAQSITDTKNYIGELFYANKKSQKNLPCNLSFLDFIWAYLPKLAINSFIEANKTNDKVSEESWKILMKIQQIGKQTWDMIEQERASFYLAFYKAIWYVIRKTNLEEEYLKIIFDQNGILPINRLDHQYELLPKPKNLNINYETENIFEK